MTTFTTTVTVLVKHCCLTAVNSVLLESLELVNSLLPLLIGYERSFTVPGVPFTSPVKALYLHGGWLTVKWGAPLFYWILPAQPFPEQLASVT